MCLSAFCLRPPRRSSSKPLPQSPPNHPTTEVPAVDLPRSGSDRDADGSQGARVVVSTQAGYPMNIISNHDFSNGLESWHPNCCHAYVASAISGFLNGVRPSSGGNYAVVTHRNESWQGLEQDITEKVTVSVKYTVTACVGVYGDLHGPAGVQATLKLENSDSSISYMFIERILVSKDCWEMLEGSFSLASMPRRVVFYLEGPPPGVDLLIDSVVVSSERMEMMVNTQNHVINIISNHDFSCGLEPWVPNCCHAYVASKESGFLNGVRPNSGENYAVVTQRSEWWQGLEQDITAKVTFGAIHDVSAYIGVYGVLHEPAEVKATLKFENSDSSTGYLSIGSAFVSKGCWQKLEGSFSLTSMPRRVVFYLEGPNPGMDLLIDSVTISCEDTEVCRATSVDENIVRNPQFEDGLSDWSGRGCKILLHNSLVNGKILPVKGRYFVSATERNQTWNGIEQEITGRVSRKLAYEVTAVVRTFGNANNADVRATLWAQSPNGREQYIGIAKIQASDKEWVKLQGKFLLNGVASRAIIFIEGPPPGTDILVDSFVVRRAMKAAASVPPSDEGFRDNIDSRKVVSTNIISNHDFSRGLQSWSLNLCDGFVVSGEFGPLKGVTAKTGSNYAVLTNRSESWHALEQDITNKVSTGLTYNVSVIVRVSGSHQEPSAVKATLKLEHLDSQLSYISVGRAMVSKERWEMLEGSFSLTSMPKCVIFYLEGPSAGVDLLIDSVVVSCSDVEHCEDVSHGANIIRNSSFTDGLNWWNPLGSCKLSIGTVPEEFFPLAKDSVNHNQPISSHFILTTNRTETWMGPSQIITDRIKLHVTYQVATWVRLGSGATSPRHVNVALGVDNQWINGGQVEANSDRWNKIRGSFRIEKRPSKVIVYVQGPPPGVDLMLSELQIFPVNRKARYKVLKEKADKIRKRDVILKFSGSENEGLVGASLKIKQIDNCFAFGACINRSNIENEDFVDFFLKNFNWAVFGNELKWYHTESQQGKFNYKDADELLDFCHKHGKQTRGHCIFWEVEDAIQPWVQSLDSNDLMIAVQNRIRGLLSRYRGKFRHYDVNNEMLHGSFYQDRLGKDIWAYMFQEAHQLDPSAILFVNDYNVEDGCDSKSTPEKYIQQILDLQERGAPIGGIGIQGHISHPVGEIICDALDKLAILGLPIWFTELDVSAENEYIRADDLEVILREAFAHPAVEGVLLWGFWELFTCRDHSHLVDAEGNINEAGKRYLALRQEWLSHADGNIDTQGEFRFSGYHGTYTVDIATASKSISRSFIVDKGDSPLVLTIDK
ncbi:endo-1,4-beta-xylanase 2-like isoform X2 [Musa acuminata AAA Group]|uniref:endo-1,4-beta-xylanase 2-like isoform X2 n=1 Tax=Musa acuminata AAA Group TaxID=214697 RepID=UPI0031DFE9E6